MSVASHNLSRPSRTLACACNAGQLSLRAGVFKVPHYGSAEFSGGFIQLAQPIVSVISSGDESSRWRRLPVGVAQADLAPQQNCRRYAA